jgi:cobalt-zinc-cadmium efflux system membrane fusion protein
MNAKTILLLIIVALAGVALGAWGMQRFGSWEAVTQAIGALRQPGVNTPSRVMPEQQPDHAVHGEHEDHEHTDETQNQSVAVSQHGAEQHDHNTTEEKRLPQAGKPARKTDSHQHAAAPSKPGADRHGHNDKHGHGAVEDDHDEEKVVRLPAEKIKQLGIETAAARSGSLTTHLSLPGTIALNMERRVHVVSRVPGIVREVRKHLGDSVRAGEVLAVIDSRELADAKATYLAARERLSLAENTFAREKDLWEKKISPEQDYLTAKQAVAEVRIELQVAAQKLHALGFSEAYVKQLSPRAGTLLTRYEVVSPLTGTAIEKHIAVGELLKDDTEAFVIADLSTVWVDLNVPPQDLPQVRKGQRVTVSAGPTMPTAEGTISYIGPVVSEETRAAITRVVLPNPDGRWRPGLFVTAMIAASSITVPVLIPKTAVQTLEGQPSVFVQTPEGFAPRPVTLGRTNETHVEITSGLQVGERYAATETFVLKADLGKSAAAHEH